ncbi:response regulator [Streptomyces cupreus]|uniref:Response regulatory domain-containing protein n=1 Tax=Streptomyces cupreus TaxID=2759956 RepID=A0A7X1J704_9ACTN|nr:hypothetical protein [Streptomyces cupreus]MBC2905373.1 hypothetical protein [Streptomyces cupreus]
MGDAAWIILIIFGSLIVLYVISAVFFPDVTRSKLHQLHKASLTTEGISLEFLSEAVKQKENRQPKAAELEALLHGLPSPRRLLWVDDNPQNNLNEVQALRSADLDVDIATSNAEAVILARHRTYDAVISDIKRDPPEPQSAGLDLGKELAAIPGVQAEDLPIIFYVGRVEQDRTTEGYPVTDTPTGLFETLKASLTSQTGVS